MTTNVWVEQNYANLKKSANNITGHDLLTEDLLSECILIFLEKPDVQDIVNSGGAFFFIIRIMLNQYRSKTSPFFVKYKKHTTETLEYMHEKAEFDYEEETNMKTVQEAYDNLHWYSKELFRLHYFNGDSYSKISRETLIPRTSVTQEIKRVKQYLKNIAQNIINTQ